MCRTWFCAALILFSSATAFAEDAAGGSEEEESTPLSAAPIEQKTGPKINEVEHGFFIGASTGLALTLSPGGSVYTPDPTTSQLTNSGKAGMAMGQSGGFELGFEPTPMFAIGVLAWGSAANTPSTYYGTCDPTATSSVSNPTNGTAANAQCPHGNFTQLTLAADARLNIAIGGDAGAVKRLFFFVRAGAGFSIVAPKNMLSNELLVFGGPGIEYFTHLRHFSVGLEADGSFGLSNKGLGVMLQPLVRYTF
ncbi:MAG: adventurous gliding motility protein CglE [Deltaproteobacteria bacterium]|nr:adventurous gliding motility protein CglE [Deltaproteobacteria bacterium]